MLQKQKSSFTGFNREVLLNFGALFPAYRIEQPVLERSEKLLLETPADQPLLRRMLREANDDLQRAIRCRAFAES